MLCSQITRKHPVFTEPYICFLLKLPSLGFISFPLTDSQGNVPTFQAIIRTCNLESIAHAKFSRVTGYQRFSCQRSSPLRESLSEYRVSCRKRSTSTARSWTTRVAGMSCWRKSERWWTWLWLRHCRTSPSIRPLWTSSPLCWLR